MNNIVRETGDPSIEFETQVTDQEKSQIEEVLLDRVDGPFEPWPENWADKMIEQLNEKFGNQSANV